MIGHAAPARVGILGNPSDGYGGRTLALAVPRFAATVTLEPADRIEIHPAADDQSLWSSLDDLVETVDHHGYGTGVQLLAATVRTFVDVADSVGHPLEAGFALEYRTTIPRQVGLGGSSALVVAALRCLSQYYGLVLPPDVLPSVALRVETEQLGISAGLQDRVVQSYGGLVAMDFGHEIVDSHFGVSHGHYEQVDASSLPPLFLAYRESAAEPSGAYHQWLRSRYEAGDQMVREVLRELAALVVEGRAALRWHDGERFAKLIGRNMELRRALGPLPDAQVELVDVAAAHGAPSTFAGSGGAIVGAYRDAEHLAEVRAALDPLGAITTPLGPGPDDVDIDDDDAGSLSNVITLDRRQV